MSLRHGFPDASRTGASGGEHAIGDVMPTSLADGKHVVVIGGGDTGSDCIGTVVPSGRDCLGHATGDHAPKPPEKEDKALTWPHWPFENAHVDLQSGRRRQTRLVAVMTTQGTHGAPMAQVESLELPACVSEPGVERRHEMVERQNEFLPPDADLVLLAMGFVHPVHDGMIEQLGRRAGRRGNVKADTETDYQTSTPESVRRRRHAPRSVTGRLGDPRRPPMRPRRRCLPNGQLEPAGMSAGRTGDAPPI